MSVVLPPMSEAQSGGWSALLDLYTTMPTGWTLVGGQMVHEQLDLRPDADDDAWRFPGRRPGQHLDPQYLVLRLRTLGTSLSALQNTARFRLAGPSPPRSS